jgi:phosphoenolpyruvate synthase/pyruvate phosphate dikinase
MNCIIALREIDDRDREEVGGKALSLARLCRMGMHVPEAFCVKAAAYHSFIAAAGLKERARSLSNLRR